MRLPLSSRFTSVIPADPLPPGAVLRLGDTRFRAGGPVKHLRFSDDGRILHGWVAGSGGAMRPVAWDAASGVRLKPATSPEPPDLPENAVPAVRLSGNRILTAGPGRAGLVWDADTRKELARLGGHTGEVHAVAASPDGKRLATGGADGLVRIWDAETLSVLSPARAATPARCGMCSSRRTAQRALTMGDDRTARVWDLTTGRELRAFAADSAIDLNAAGTGIIVRAGGTTAIRDVLTGLEVIPPDHAGRSTIILPARHEESQAGSRRVAGRPRPREAAKRWGDRTHRVGHEESSANSCARQHRAARVLGFTPGRHAPPHGQP